MDSFSLLLAQINPQVGAIKANAKKIKDIILSEQAKHDLILFPELALSGYPPEDLLLRPAFLAQIDEAMNDIAATTSDCHVILGYPCLKDGALYNAAAVFYNSKQIATYYKQILPNYGVFDEKRYFTPGTDAACLLRIKNHCFALCVCEDIWHPGPVESALEAGAQTILCLNASPFDYNKPTIREQLLAKHAQKGVNLVYVNLVGGQDETLFDGQSLAVNAQGMLCARLPAFQEALGCVEISPNGDLKSGLIAPRLSEEAEMYGALVLGTKDYVEKNRFSGVLLGLSGGIDSALTLAIAVDALGRERVHAVLMPSRFTASISLEDALEELAETQVSHTLLSIEPAYNAFLETLAPSFAGLATDTTEENLQARIRGVLLMALSNKTGKLVLTTSNKSETTVGYATLYGDMAGGFSVLKDVLKTQVYRLARYRNSITKIIPERVLTRAPSAELAENQTDQDSLPDYAILDAIIQGYMEKNQSIKELIASGLPVDAVKQVVTLLKRNEYKRRQAAPGIKISARMFGRDWRYPITSDYQE